MDMNIAVNRLVSSTLGYLSSIVYSSYPSQNMFCEDLLTLCAQLVLYGVNTFSSLPHVCAWLGRREQDEAGYRADGRRSDCGTGCCRTACSCLESSCTYHPLISSQACSELLCVVCNSVLYFALDWPLCPCLIRLSRHCLYLSADRDSIVEMLG
ncbi:hypothetical protein DFH29DRAFT_1084079 [Suillus ampliporus]|nr:hypothetical protein DFH29DRAFT_1084079 [Suillus ampliporus]